MIPEKNVGFAMMINAEDGEIIKGLTNELLDHYLGKPTQDWSHDYIAFKKKRLARRRRCSVPRRRSPPRSARRCRSPAMPAPIATPGTADPISEAPGGLRIDFEHSPGMTGKLDHWQYDTFRTHWDNPAFENADVTFALDAQGKVAQITMKPVSPLADFSWDYQDLLFKPEEAAR